ncbi:uncharacterized protein LOC126908461 isoform X3 [Daktulosphaira vitifoliae]|uniref:uncharacterized protein LOC126908461 isoform X3 n=1 Tax=Daktulosphaira vitifoliae TaxID=58002 RepID=UPI0021A9B580|nr:uncharacterized protein LOC126908461 isoform X3 [Daktulosphaira vitifoliae]
MSPIRFLYFSLYLICIVGFSKPEKNSKKNAEVLTNLLTNNKWKNLNDVNEVFYYTKVFTLNTIYESCIDSINCNNKLRAATLILGCSYVKDLKTFYFMFSHFNNYCLAVYNRRGFETYAYNCTKNLLKSINKLYSLLKIMQGALKALDILHTNSWNICRRHDFLFIRLLSDLQKNHEYFKDTHLFDNSMITIESFNSISNFLDNKLPLINKKSSFCAYISYNLNEMWQEWVIEYKTIVKKSNLTQLFFFEYLNKKLHEKIKHIMFDKFIDLGFKYDLSAHRIVVPKQLNSDNNTNYGFTDEMTALIQNESKDDTKQNNNINYALIDEMIALIQNASKEDTELTISNEELEVPVENPGMPETINFFPGAISNEELEVPVENPGMPETINFFPGVICNKELEVPDVNPRTPELINFFQEDKDLKVTSEDPKTIELIDFFEKEVPSGDPKTPELIDFLEQGLNPGVSTEDILEPLDIDKKKITMFNFL